MFSYLDIFTLDTFMVETVSHHSITACHTVHEMLIG
jgi:hypothetical protein